MSPALILDVIARPGSDEEFPDWRPVHRFIVEHASCRDLIEALASADSADQRRLICYAIHRRRRPCRTAVPHVLPLLEDADHRVREEAVNLLGGIMFSPPKSPPKLAAQVGKAMLDYLAGHPGDSHYLTLTGLGATRWPPAFETLRNLLHDPNEMLRRAGARGLLNFGSPGALPDLREARKVESSPSTLREIEIAIATLEQKA